MTLKVNSLKIKRSNKTEEQKETLDNIADFYDTQRSIIDLRDDFRTISSETRYKSIKETKGNKNKNINTHKKCLIDYE